MRLNMLPATCQRLSVFCLLILALAAPSLARAEWEHINRVLSDAGGNISEAARRLGIHRRSLQRKLQKYPPRE